MIVAFPGHTHLLFGLYYSTFLHLYYIIVSGSDRKKAVSFYERRLLAENKIISLYHEPLLVVSKFEEEAFFSFMENYFIFPLFTVGLVFLLI